MARLRTFRAGSARPRSEGLRIGTVRFLPRGVPKKDYARLDYFDVWLPLLAPSRDLIRRARPGEWSDDSWRKFAAAYRREMSATDARQAIRLLARLAERTPIAIGCYCDDESRCHRSVLRELIEAERKG
jgi:uncharacterized protein YeaO (DUF488 family)